MNSQIGIGLLSLDRLRLTLWTDAARTKGIGGYLLPGIHKPEPDVEVLRLFSKADVFSARVKYITH
jgi:hypothetical protein